MSSGSLDPEDWDAFRALAHRMVDDMVDWLATVEERPVWRPVPAEVQARFSGPAPRAGTDAEAVYQEFRDFILPYPTGNAHPRFWGWVRGAGSPLGMMADMLASGMNPHTGGFDQSSTYVEKQVIGWMSELVGMPPESSGILVSGCSMANLVGLSVARMAKAGYDVREKGLQRGAGPPLVLYASRETHSSVQKAARLLGLGDESYRRIAVDGERRIDVPALAAAIAADRAAGARPFCVVGNAGTVNTGAIDDLNALADLCAAQGLWLHVDGAFGALAAWSDRLRPRVAGIERADSLAFDLHKWGSLPFDVGCALVRDPVVHRGAFEITPEYLAERPRGVAMGGATYSELGVQLSRRFRALKLWMALKVHGTDGIALSVERNVDQAARLAAAVAAHPRLELAATVPLNIVCFRYVAPGLTPERLDAVNEEILMRIQESGEAVPSSTLLAGRFVLRAGIVNQRTRDEDVDRLAELVVETGDAVVGEG